MTDRSKIKAKAYAVLEKDGKVLMHEIKAHGELIGYRIPGGHVEFGEKSLDALIREIKEELDTDIENISLLGVDENIFIYEGKPGHEITFIYKADFADQSLYQQDVLKGYEQGNNSNFDLFWIDPFSPPGNLAVFPEGLKKLLK